MPLPLSYPGLRCVLEHLEAVKRAHIIGRAPSLQKIDKLVPFCLGNLNIGLNFSNKKLIINKLSIECDQNNIQFKLDGKRFSRKISKSQEDKINKVVHFYFCNRSITNVDKLYLGPSASRDVRGLNLKLRTNSLNALVREKYETAFPFIDPRSYPLKTVTTMPDTAIFDNLNVTSAETLHLHLFSGLAVRLDNLKKLNNQTVLFGYCSSSSVEIIPFIEYYIETKKDIKTTFVISLIARGFLFEKLLEFKQAFGEYISDLDDVKERVVPGLPKFSIPINGDSKIHVYAIEVPDVNGRWKIVIKPVSAVLEI
ncbi:hypothetical protein CRE_17388 [Caenorhabditis remanei]|uniref:DUF38 domain-containing protein n=1 Tax=Caenorhabditis remanei TaxID=31234 RepID=E3N237_CAERE|nr:hypothetical protein CRE_17388 [Caenorhabditis remanei]